MGVRLPGPATLPYIRAELPAGFLICSAEDMGHYLIAQMNGGQYHDHSVLSPQGIAFMQTRSLGFPMATAGTMGGRW